MSDNAWNNPNYPFLDFTECKVYARNHNQAPVELRSSDILFVGSCDISGRRKEKYWHEIYCENLNLNPNDYVKIGAIGQPMNALVRKIYGYLKAVETPPRKILMVAPVSMTEMILGAKAYPIPRTFDVIEFFERIDFIPQDILSRITHLMLAHRQSIGPGQLLYEFCQNFSFLEMMMLAYNIELHWTPNLTRKAKNYYKQIDTFLNAHSYAKQTFLGYNPNIVNENDTDLDFPSQEAHKTLADLFLSINKV